MAAMHDRTDLRRRSLQRVHEGLRQSGTVESFSEAMGGRAKNKRQNKKRMNGAHNHKKYRPWCHFCQSPPLRHALRRLASSWRVWVSGLVVINFAGSHREILRLGSRKGVTQVPRPTFFAGPFHTLGTFLACRRRHPGASDRYKTPVPPLDAAAPRSLQAVPTLSPAHPPCG